MVAFSTLVKPLRASVPPLTVSVPEMVVIWLEGKVPVPSSVRLMGPLSVVRLLSSRVLPPVSVSEIPSVLVRLARLDRLTSPPLVALTFQPPCSVTVVADTSRMLPVPSALNVPLEA